MKPFNTTMQVQIYLIAFKVGSVRTRTFAPPPLPLMGKIKVIFWYISKFRHRVRIDGIYCVKTVTIEGHFDLREVSSTDGGK